MKDTIVADLHRYRAEHARRFNYDLRAMGEDLQRRQWESGHKVVGWDARRKRMVTMKRPKTARAKPLAAHK
jgi:hypothetical protein